MTDTFLQNHAVPASVCLEALRRCGVDHVVTVPDWLPQALHAKLEAGEEPGMKLINTSNENQAITLAAGLTLGGKRPVVVMQNQGVYNCVNTLRAICIDAHVPTVILAGQFGREYANLGQPATESRRARCGIGAVFRDQAHVGRRHGHAGRAVESVRALGAETGDGVVSERP